MDRCFLCEKQVRSIKRKVIVNLVCRNLVIAVNAVLVACVHHKYCTHNVCFKKISFFFDGTSNVKVRSKISRYIVILLFKKLINFFNAADIILNKAKFWLSITGVSVERLSAYVNLSRHTIRYSGFLFIIWKTKLLLHENTG